MDCEVAIEIDNRSYLERSIGDYIASAKFHSWANELNFDYKEFREGSS